MYLYVVEIHPGVAAARNPINAPRSRVSVDSERSAKTAKSKVERFRVFGEKHADVLLKAPHPSRNFKYQQICDPPNVCLGGL